MTTLSDRTRDTAPAEVDVAACLDAALDHLRGLQHADGWWKGELATNVTMDAEDLMLRHFLGVATATTDQETARWLRSQQSEDGSWPTFPGGPGDLSTTVEAWVALRMADDPEDAPHLLRAAAFVRAHGGLEHARVFTHIWLSLFGLWSWEDCPDLPPELVLLPSWAPLNIYDWACWARQTIVPLTIVSALRPVRPAGFEAGVLRSGVAPPPAPLTSLGGVFGRLDRVLHRYTRHPLRPLREAAMRKATAWVLAHQEADGGWGGIQPPWVYSLIALHLRGYSLDHPAMRAGLAGLDGFTVRADGPDGPVRWLEACQSPVWDTGLAVAALLDGGVAADDPAVLRATDWLLQEQIADADVPADWRVRRPHLPSGGWAFEFANDGYPDTDDTAEIVLALRRVRHPDRDRLAAALDRAVAWTTGMQSGDGGWGAFDADNTRTLAEKLPFCDFGAVIDAPSADVTAHIVEMLAAEGRAGEEPCRRGVRWLLDAQEPDGSWFGRWGANHVYGTGAVVPALVAAGVPADHECVRAAVRWLERHQNDDGGWGEDLRSYADPSWIGRGASTPSQTAWALLALLAAGERSSSSVARGVAHLVATQRSDGTWDEEHYTGTGFPGDFYIGYRMYRLIFPVWALGRYLGRAAGREADSPTDFTGAPPETEDGVDGDDRRLDRPSRAIRPDGGPVVLTPLRSEWLAVHGLRGLRTAPVRCTGRARAAPGSSPALVAGVAGGLVGDLAPGDLVVADEVRSPGRTWPCHGAPLLEGALRRAGLPVRRGPVAGADHLVDTAAERARLAATGALAVDTESALLADLGGSTTVLRAVLDTPARPLRSTHTIAGAVRALAALRRAAPVLEDWAAAVADRQVLLAGPRSFCAGVERAIEIVERALEGFGAPVYVRRQIVHNRHVVADLEARGAIFVEELDEVPEGSLAVLAAHGVAPEVREQAERRRLRVIDATCPLVAKVHQEVRRFAADDRTVLLIGHPDHEEVVGTRGEAPERVLVVPDPTEAARVEVPDPDRVAYVMQTTLAVEEAAETAAVLRDRFPVLAAPHKEDICYATTNRQRAVREVARRTELVIVIGSQNSSNSQRLAEVAEAEGTRARLVDDAGGVELAWLAGVRRIGVTAGASAPPRLVDDLVTALSGLGRVEVEEHTTLTEDVWFALPKQVAR